MAINHSKELYALGIPENQLPITDLQSKLVSGEPAFTIDVEMDTDTDTPYLATLYYSESEGSIVLKQFVLTLYHPDTDDIFRCQPFPVKGRPDDITIRQGKNLLQGRAILIRYLPGGPFADDTWLCFNFSRRNADGAYVLEKYSLSRSRRLEQILPKYPIVGWQNTSYASAIVAALQAGEMVLVNLHLGRTLIRPKVLEYDPRFPLIKLHLPSRHRPTISIDPLKREELCQIQ